MRFVLMLLMMAVQPAWADWVKVLETENTVYYVDPTTLRKDGNLQTISKLQDLKKRASGGEMSRQLLEEYDCQGQRNRTRSFTAHSEPMGRGLTIVRVDSPAAWEKIEPGVIRITTNGIACAPEAKADDPKAPGGSYKP